MLRIVVRDDPAALGITEDVLIEEINEIDEDTTQFVLAVTNKSIFYIYFLFDVRYYIFCEMIFFSTNSSFLLRNGK